MDAACPESRFPGLTGRLLALLFCDTSPVPVRPEADAADGGLRTWDGEGSSVERDAVDADVD